MKTTKKKFEAFKKNLSNQFSREVGDRKTVSGDEVITKDTNYSITKYLRGAVLKDWTDATVEKAMFKKTYDSTVGTSGGFLVPERTSEQIIELLKERAIVRSMPGVRIIDMMDKLVVNRQDSAVSTSWGSENALMSEDTNATWGQVSLELKKLKCLQKLSREMLANANPSVDALVIEDMVQEIALAEDLAFLEGTGGQQPTGFYYHPNVKSTDLGAVLAFTDITEAMYQIETAHAKINGWIGNPREKNTLRNIRDGNGNVIYAENRITDQANAEIDSIYGVPAKWTTTIPITLRPDASQSYMVAGDWSNVLIGNKPQIRIESTDTGGNAFEYDQVFLKVVREVDMAIRHPETMVVVKGIAS